ncbi:MAG: hypothetical protein HY355_01275 [Armatimonadetes bacterium]|nr:hypothetical protein [Armatimonadota bacterium]
MGLPEQIVHQRRAPFRDGAALPSWIAFVLTAIASAATLPVATFPWNLSLPVAAAAVPLFVPLSWVRLLAAFLLTFWTWSTMGAWAYYVPGWLAALFAAARPDSAQQGTRSTLLRLALIVLVVGLAFLMIRFLILRKPNGWEFFPRQPYPLSNRRIEVVYGKRIDGGCSFSGPTLTRAPGEPLPEGRMLGIDHRDCTVIFEVGVPPPGARTPPRP